MMSLLVTTVMCLPHHHSCSRRCRLSGTYLATAGNCADRYIRIWNWAKRNDCLHILKPNVEFELDGHEEKIVLGPTKRGVRVAQIVDIGKVRQVATHRRIWSMLCDCRCLHRE